MTAEYHHDTYPEDMIEHLIIALERNNPMLGLKIRVEMDLAGIELIETEGGIMWQCEQSEGMFIREK